MKHSIEWHQNCWRNSTSTCNRLKAQRDQLQNDIDRLGAENDFYKQQITKAMELKKDGFDKERFMKGKEKTK
jgi:hypothetical protein